MKELYGIIAIFVTIKLVLLLLFAFYCINLKEKLLPVLKKLLYILLFTQLTQYTLHSQQWRVFTTSNSPLPSNVIGSVVIDTNNVKWVGTTNGLVRIEGNGWIIYDTTNSPLPENHTIPRAIDRLNNLWVGTYSKGILKYDGINWTLYNTTNSGLPTNGVATIAIDNNNIKWIGPGGVAKFDDVTWVIYNTINSGLPSNAVTSIAVENDIKWIGMATLSAGMAKFNDTSWTIYNTSNSGLPSNVINLIKLDVYNNKWICTEFGGLAKFNSIANSWTVYNTSNSGIPGNGLYGFTSYGYVKYVATSFGIGRFNDTTWQVFNTSNSPLPSNVTGKIELDRFNNLWIPTSNGLAIYNPNGIIGINTNITNTPKNFILHQNFPNPFNPVTKIEFELNKTANIILIVYNIEGKIIKELIKGRAGIGKHSIEFNGTNLSSGIYFYELKTESFIETRKMVLVK